MPTVPTDVVTTVDVPAHSPRSISWAAILAGCVAALTIHMLATLLGMGLGIGASDPLTNDDIVSDFSIGLGIAWSVSALIALWVGGWVAGRGARTTNVKLGGLHGFLVWCTATVLTAIFLTSGASALIGGAAKVAGKSLRIAGQTAAGLGQEASQTAGDGQDTMLQQFVRDNSDFIGSFIDDLASARPNTEGAQSRPLSPTARREIGWALFRFFSEDGQARSPEVRDAAIRTVAQHTGLNEADARRRIDELATSYDRAQANLREVKERAEQKAREVAERTKRSVAQSAIWTVVAFVIGAFAASWGGRRGASRAWEDMYPEVHTVVPPLT